MVEPHKLVGELALEWVLKSENMPHHADGLRVADKNPIGWACVCGAPKKVDLIKPGNARDHPNQVQG